MASINLNYSNPTNDDEQFEEELSRNPYIVKTWYYYIISKLSSRPIEFNLICERAVKSLPGSYKLWSIYLSNRINQCNDMPINSPKYEATNNAFERALMFMHKMPLIWMAYLKFLLKQFLLTRTRQTFDRAIRALPITQHDKIWPLYIKFVRQSGIPSEVGCRIYRRATQLLPDKMEERIKYLKSVHQYDEAAILLSKILSDENFVFKNSKSKQKLWEEFCNLICKNPEEIVSLNVDAIIRSALKKYPIEIGQLWTSLADYYLRQLQFEKTRDIYEEGLSTVITLRDFEFIFNIYCQHEEVMIKAKIDKENEMKDNTEILDNDFDIETEDIDLLMARYEDLLDRRPLLTNSVLLRQNPNNVDEWIKRARIYEKKKDLLKVIETYAIAIKTVEPAKAIRNPHYLWINLAKFYEENTDDLNNSRETFKRAVKHHFTRIDQIASIWCEWTEMEIRHKNYDEAFRIIRQATVLPTKKALYGDKRIDKHELIQNQVYRSTKLWALYADLEETFGTVKTTQSVYNKIMDLKIATPLIVLNYTNYLEKKKYFEESFKVYERGLKLFKYPQIMPIINMYLKKFIERFKGTKLERTRELFEQIVSLLPSKEAKQIFLLYGQFEEEFGTPKNAIKVYDKMCKTANPNDRYDLYLIYINRTAILYGDIKTREIYERAIKELPNSNLPAICLRYIMLEVNLGEIDRARAIYHYGSRFADPRIEEKFWDNFENFEADYGNIDTFSEMNRIKRSVSASFTNFLVDEVINKNKVTFVKGKAQGLTEMQKLELESKKIKEKLNLNKVKNPDEISLDDVAGEKDEEVYKDDDIKSDKLKRKMGALERLKKKARINE